MTTDLVPFEALENMAVVLGRKKLFGMDADEMLPLMLIAQAEGRHPASVAQEYDVIQGKPALKSRAALARFQAAGGSIQWKECTPEKATAMFDHPQGGTLTVSWTMDRAKKAGLSGKDNWQKYPEAMLRARVIAEGIRAIYPGCLSGMYLGEEVADLDQRPMRTVTEEEPEAPPEDPEIIDLRGKLGTILDSGRMSAKGVEAVSEVLGRDESDPIILRDTLAKAEANAEKTDKARAEKA